MKRPDTRSLGYPAIFVADNVPAPPSPRASSCRLGIRTPARTTPLPGHTSPDPRHPWRLSRALIPGPGGHCSGWSPAPALAGSVRAARAGRVPWRGDRKVNSQIKCEGTALFRLDQGVEKGWPGCSLATGCSTAPHRGNLAPARSSSATPAGGLQGRGEVRLLIIMKGQSSEFVGQVKRKNLPLLAFLPCPTEAVAGQRPAISFPLREREQSGNGIAREGQSVRISQSLTPVVI